MVKSGSENSVTNEYLRQENERLNDKMRQMDERLTRVLQAQSIEFVIQNGMKDIVDMLEPLRSLRPERTKLTVDEAKVLKSIRATLKRPDFSDLETGLDLVQTATGRIAKGMAS